MSGYPRNVAVMVGPSECGKSELMWERFISCSPRVISIDPNGEMVDRDERTIEVYNVDELRDALDQAARARKWHIAVCMPQEKMPELGAFLVQYLNPSKSGPEHKSFPVAVGGLAINCEEAEWIVPNSQVDWVQKGTCGFFLRGRHNRLTMLMSTKKPALINRAVTENADHLVAFGTQETVVWKYWAATTTPAMADRIARLEAYHCLWIQKDEQRAYHMDAKRKVRAVLDYTGAEV